MNDESIETRGAEIVRELELAEFGCVHGVTCDAAGNVWFAYGEGGLACVEPNNGRVLHDFPDMGATAGTAFDGRCIWQIAGKNLVRIDPETGGVEQSVPLPEPVEYSGMAWADGALWLGRFSGKELVKIDPATGEILKTLRVSRFVTGVEWIDGELWHGTWAGPDEKDADADLRRIDPETGVTDLRIEMPDGSVVSGVGADHEGRLWCGRSAQGGVSAIRRPLPTG